MTSTLTKTTFFLFFVLITSANLSGMKMPFSDAPESPKTNPVTISLTKCEQYSVGESPDPNFYFILDGRETKITEDNLHNYFILDARKTEINEDNLRFLPSKLRARLVGIKLFGCKHVHSLIHWLGECAQGQFPNLTFLDVGIPEHIGEYTRSRYVFSGIHIEAISKLKKLTRLNLGGHGMYVDLLKPITELTNLIHLDLSGNNIGPEYADPTDDGHTIDFIEKLVAHLKKLKYLNLSDNQLNKKHKKLAGELLPNTEIKF